MRKSVFIFLILIAIPICSKAETTVGKIDFDVREESEAIVTARLSVTGYKWSDSGWSPPLEIRLDGKRAASLIPVRGEESANYKYFLGPVEEGKHQVELIDPADGRQGVNLDLFYTVVTQKDDPEYRLLRYAPIILGREDSESTDVPIFAWVVERKRNAGDILEYSIVWTNEDGGTPTSELMARYGRTVDIEYVYRVEFDAEGQVVSETFQGSGHKETHYRGKKLGDHPFLRTCTKNNMVSDEGESELIFPFVPVLFDEEGTRERMLDRETWISRVMHEELVREKKLTKNLPDPMRVRIDDVRRYVLVDLETEPLFSGPRLEVALRLKGSNKWFTADQGVEQMLLGRFGKARVGVWVPRGTGPNDILGIRLRPVGDSGGRLNIRALGPLTMLDKEFMPHKIDVPWEKTRTITVDGKPLLIKLETSSSE